MKTVQLRDNMPAPKADECDGAVEELIEAFGAHAVCMAFIRSSAGESIERYGSGATHAALTVLIRQIVFAQNPRLEAEVIAIGVGVLLEDDATMTRIALKYGITKQALSKRVLKFNDEHNLRPSSLMRAEKDRGIYALTNHPKQGQNT